MPLDPGGRAPGRIALAVALYRAPGGGPEPRPLVVALVGGPGQAALPLAAQLRSALPRAALHGRDLLVFDERGTGQSGALNCPGVQRDSGLDADVLAQCATQLGPTRRYYATRQTVADIELLRRLLRAPSVGLYATSYGTYVALSYARAHPRTTSWLLLDSIVAPSNDPLNRHTLQAAPRVLAGYCRLVRCSRVTPGVLRDFRVVAARLRTQAASGTADQVSDAALALLVLDGDIDSFLRSATPAALHAAANGDESLLAKIVRAASVENGQVGNYRQLSLAAYYAASCQDQSMPWRRRTSVAARLQAGRQLAAAATPAARLPFDQQVVLSFSDISVCAGWPEAQRRRPLSLRPRRLAGIPTLILSGGQDTRSPLEDARAVHRQIPGSDLLIAPASGHQVIGNTNSDCTAAVRAFFAHRRVPTACPSTGDLPRPVSAQYLRQVQLPG